MLGEVGYERPVAEGVLSYDVQVEGICRSCKAVPLPKVVFGLQEGDRFRRVPPLGPMTGRAIQAPAGGPSQAEAQQFVSASRGEE